MLSVIVYSTLLIIGIFMAFGMLAENNWRPVLLTPRTNNPVLSHVLTHVVTGLIYWWVISNVGLILATLAMLSVWVYNFVAGFKDIAEYGSLRITPFAFWATLPLYAFIVIQLFATVT